MLILTKTHLLINTRHIKDIYCDDGKILAEFADNSELLLGDYETQENAENVIDKIAQCFDAITTFKMP